MLCYVVNVNRSFAVAVGAVRIPGSHTLAVQTQKALFLIEQKPYRPNGHCSVLTLDKVLSVASPV